MQSDQNQALEVLPQLRLATAALHRQVDSLAPLAKPTPSISDYLAHLHFNYLWMRDVQAALSLAGQLPAEWLAHNALCLQQLQQDLAAAEANGDVVLNPEAASVQHGISPAAISALAVPVHQGMTLPEGPGASWGVQYVIEGSFLGSSMLYQRLRPILPAACPMLFFSARHEGCGARWRSFKQAIESTLTAEPMTRASRVAEAEQGAQAAFAHFLDILQAPAAKASDDRQRYA